MAAMQAPAGNATSGIVLDPATGSVAPAPVEGAIRQDMVARFLEMFIRQNHRSQGAFYVVLAPLGWLWFHRAPSAIVPLWAAMVVLVGIGRFRFTERFVRSGGPMASEGRIAMLLAVNGLLAAAPLAAFGHYSYVEQMAITMILMSVAIISAVTTCGFKRPFFGFALPILLPLGAAWIALGEAAGPDDVIGPRLLGALVLFCLVFMVGLANRVNGTFEEASRYRLGQERSNRELQQALERADESNRAKTQFLAAASHDLRQPIHGITILVGALGLRPLDAQSQEIVGQLESVNRILSRQLDSLLDISKLDAGVVQPKLAAVRLDALAAGHFDALQPVASAQGVRLELGRADPVVVVSDASLLSRVLGNLTDNALKFTPAGGTLRIDVTDTGDRALLEVTDTGVGIPSAELDKVFREFYQVGNVGRDRARGLGLGLSIVHRLCRLIGADVRLQSEQGVGTTVSIALPKGRDASMVRVTTAELRLDLAGRSILVVDDESLVRESMRLLLAQFGCTVHLASEGDEAAALATAHPIDLVMCDFRLGDRENGLEVIRRIQTMHPAVRAILITGDTAPDRIQRAQASGIPLLFKPVTVETLLDAIGDHDPPAKGR